MEKTTATPQKMTSKKQIEKQIEKEVSKEISKKEDQKIFDVSDIKQLSKKDKISKKKNTTEKELKTMKNSPQEVSQELMKESSQELMKESSQELMKESPQELMKESPQELMKEKKPKKKEKKELKSEENTVVKEEDIKDSKGKKKPVKSLIPRGRTGYNIFLKEKIGNFADVPQKDRMKLVGDLWKTTSKEEKDKFNFIANEEKKNLPIPESKKTDKKRKLSGYNIFMKEHITGASGDSQRDKLMQVSQKWKNLDQKEKDEYNEKAKL
jgi:hypothetical protein